MSPQTLKMFIMFLLAAALLNMSNYLFYWLYSPPSRRAVRLEVQVSEHTKMFRLMTKRRITHPVKWSNFLLCENKSTSAPVPVQNLKSSSSEYEYRENPDPSAFYYYTGDKNQDKLCPETPSELGPLKLDVPFGPQEVDKLYKAIGPGGHYEETKCIPRQSVAVIVAYREEENQLLQFLYSMHTFLMKQQLEYQIFVVKQSNMTTPLNPGRLLNAGYSESRSLKKSGDWRCLVFHDHNIVPVDSRNLYRCSNEPQQLVSQVGNRSYDYNFGGAIAVRPQQFLKVNGFSNLYQNDYTSVGEDLTRRLTQANYRIIKSTNFGKYKQIKNKDESNAHVTSHQQLWTSSPLNLIDGLSTLSYTLNRIDFKALYTLIDVDIDKPQINSTDMWDRLFNQGTTPEPTTKTLKV